MRCLMFLTFFVVTIALVNGHTYHLGSCPVVEPMQGFEMSKFLGIWHVIQKTSTASKCISYNYTRGEEPGEYFITQDSDIPVLGLTSLKHEYHYTGEISVPEPSTPARMKVRFPLSIGGSASHVVFATDYINYAGIFTCQSLQVVHRQSATILSRRKTLDKIHLDLVRQKLASFGVDPFSLSIVEQTDCSRGNNSFDLSIDPNTFTAENIGQAVRKTGEKIGDGIEWLGNQGSKVYHKLTGKDEEPPKPVQPIAPTVTSIPNIPNGKLETNDVEWIP